MENFFFVYELTQLEIQLQMQQIHVQFFSANWKAFCKYKYWHNWKMFLFVTVNVKCDQRLQDCWEQREV
jgi:hypothetical protein